MLVRVALASWLLFAVVTVIVSRWPYLWIDRQVLGFIDSELFHRGPVSYTLAHLGAAPTVTPLVIAACAYAVLRHRALIPAAIVGGGYALVALGVTVTKSTLRRAEPTLPPHVLGYSYPSGHAASAVAGWFGIAFGWWLLQRMAGDTRRHRAPFVIAIAVEAAVWLMMLVRSAHWLTDMIGGTLLGAACLSSAAVVALSPPFLTVFGPRRQSVSAGAGSAASRAGSEAGVGASSSGSALDSSTASSVRNGPA